MKKYFWSITATIALGCFLCTTSTIRAEFGDIKKILGSYDCGEAGGLTFKTGEPEYFYETWRKEDTIWKRRASDGGLEEIIDFHLDSGPSDGVCSMSWDNTRMIFWISDPWMGEGTGTEISKLPEDGGHASAGFNHKNCACVGYYEPEDRVWVTDEVHNSVTRYSSSGTYINSFTPAEVGPHGIIQIGDRLWITDWYKHQNYITEYTTEGQLTGRQIEITGREGLQSDTAAIELAFDGTYLWCLTCNPCRVLQIDIEYKTPTPVTIPTPVSPIIDSGDYNGDSTSDIAVFRASSGLWAIRGITRAYFGANGDIPAPGDYDGDGNTDIALFRASSGLWAVRGITRAYFGSSGDTAVPGDYRGEGTCNSAIFRPASGLWAIRGLTRVYFGASSDIPMPVYASGRSMGKDIAIFRPSSGLWAIKDLSRTYFGASSDMPVAGNYTTTQNNLNIGIFRASAGLWAIKSVTRAYFGGLNDKPVPGNYTGFLPDNISIFRASAGLWAIKGQTRVYFGSSGDIPIAGLAINPSTTLTM